jgi:hypothetical protein
MISKRPPRKPDLFVILLLLVAIGLSATLTYQINLYFNDGDLSIARQARALPPDMGG